MDAAERKDPGRNVETATKLQKTSAPTTRDPAIESIFLQPCVLGSDDPKGNPPGEPDTFFWIKIKNVHVNALDEDFFRALFKGCAHVRSLSSELDLARLFQGNIGVAFERKEDAEEAVYLFHDNVKLFHQTWALSLRKQTYLRFSDAMSPTESVDDNLAQIIQDDAVGNNMVTVANIDERVPEGVVVALLKTAGRVRSHEICYTLDGRFQGMVDVRFIWSKDAIAAVKRFDGNITFFKKTWLVALDDERLRIQSPVLDGSPSEG